MSKRTVVREAGEYGNEVEVVASHDSRVRLERSFARRVYQGTQFELVPELTRSGAAAAEYASLPEATGCESEFGSVFRTVVNRGEYFASRKVVERTRTDGSRLLSVAPRLPEVVEASSGNAGEYRKRKYTLVQFLTDSYLREKFDLSRKVIESVREQALGDADGAAARLQRVIRNEPGCEDFVVSAGQYSRSRKWAKDSVRRAASAANPIENIMDCRIFGEKISIYGPGPDTDLRWSVTAPVWEAAVALQVHRIVQTTGTAPAMFALGAELTVLAVDIHNGHSYECPTVQQHVGNQELLSGESSPMTLSLLSATARAKLEELAQHVLPLELEGEQVATAVAVGRLGALVNGHVLERAGDAGAFVGGTRLEASKQISRDLWIAKASVPQEHAWTLRDAVIGEQVFIYHSVNGRAVVSPPVTLRCADGVTVTMSVASAMKPGMSGGAIVALKDLALIGVYEGAGATQAVGLAFTAEHFTDLCTLDDASSASRSQSDPSVDGWYGKFKKRGLGKVLDSVMHALVPLSTVAGQHVGCALAVGDSLCTTVVADQVPVRVGGSGLPLDFVRVNVNGMFRAEGSGSVASSVPQLMRRPVLSEKVLFVGRDTGGPYYTVSSAPVVHIGTAAKTFVVGLPEDDDMLPLTGAVVVALSDGAVLGMYHSRTITTGYGAGVQCLAVKQDVVCEVTLPAAVLLSQIFPFLHLDAWPDGVAEAVITHASCSAFPSSRGMLAYGFIGDAALKAVLGDVLMRAGLPKPEWDTRLQALQSNVALAAASERLGLAAIMRTGGGLVVPPGSKAHADILEAVVGAAFKYEPYAVLEQLAAACGAITLV